MSTGTRSHTGLTEGLQDIMFRVFWWHTATGVTSHILWDNTQHLPDRVWINLSRKGAKFCQARALTPGNPWEMYNKQSQPFDNKVQIQTRSCSTFPHNWKKAHSQQRSKNVLSETLVDEGGKTGREYTEDPGQSINGLQLTQGHHNT